MSVVLVMAPHPDDETLGCGGSILRHVENGDQVHWLIVTDMRIEYGHAATVVSRRQMEIQKVSAAYRFSKVHNLGLPPARLDTLPKGDMVQAMARVINEISPEILYLPFRGDVHSDHATVFDVAASCTKWFRYPSIKRVLCYETLSETDFGINPDGAKYTPNSFVDITSYLDRKIKIAQMYDGELGEFPFPRSEKALTALAQLRGVACGCHAAESFMMLREICK